MRSVFMGKLVPDVYPIKLLLK